MKSNPISRAFMKLLIVTQKIDTEDSVMGFAHRWVENIAKNVDEVFAIGLAVGKHHLPKNVHIYSTLKERGYPRIIRAMVFYYRLLTILPRVDGVFIHMCPEYVLALRPLNFFFRKPIAMWYAHIVVSPEAKKALSLVDTVFTPSKEAFAFHSKKVVSTGHGIDTEYFHLPLVRKKNIPPVLISLSRLSKVKKVETLLEAVNILVHKRNYTNFHIKIIGGPARPEDDAYMKGLKKMADDFHINEYLQWAGEVSNDNAREEYWNTDIFLRMQEGGGFGKTELESMACGTPAILCTHVYKPLLGDFHDDIYYLDGSAEGLATCIQKVLGWSEERRSEYSNLARKIVVENHNLAILAKKIAGSFREEAQREVK